MKRSPKSTNSSRTTKGRYRGPSHSAPYPLSRLSPAYELVDIAKEISRADSTLGVVTHAKLHVIAEQIRTLQAQALTILREAESHSELHHVKCRFQKQAGGTYHLYREATGERYFSMLSPADWNGEPPDSFEGSYRLEHDMTWKRLDEFERSSR